MKCIMHLIKTIMILYLEFFNDIYNLNKYISVITINRDEVPDPNNLYYVKTDSSNVYVDFTIFDSPLQ